MESEPLEFNIRTVPAGTFTSPPNKALQKTISVTEPIPYQLRPRSSNEIVFVIGSDLCFLRFLETLLDGLISLEGSRVYTDLDSIKQLVSPSKLNLSLSTAPRNSQLTVSKLSGVPIDSDPRHYPKYFVVISLGHLLSVQAVAFEEGVETFRLVQRIREACARGTGEAGLLVVGKADQYIKKYPQFDPRQGGSGIFIQLNPHQIQPMMEPFNPFNSEGPQLNSSNNESQRSKDPFEPQNLREIHHEERGMDSSVRLGTSSRHTTSSIYSQRFQDTQGNHEEAPVQGKESHSRLMESSFVKMPQKVPQELLANQHTQREISENKTPFDDSNGPKEDQEKLGSSSDFFDEDPQEAQGSRVLPAQIPQANGQANDESLEKSFFRQDEKPQVASLNNPFEELSASNQQAPPQNPFESSVKAPNQTTPVGSSFFNDSQDREQPEQKAKIQLKAPNQATPVGSSFFNDSQDREQPEQKAKIQLKAPNQATPVGSSFFNDSQDREQPEQKAKIQLKAPNQATPVGSSFFNDSQDREQPEQKAKIQLKAPNQATPVGSSFFNDSQDREEPPKTIPKLGGNPFDSLPNIEEEQDQGMSFWNQSSIQIEEKAQLAFNPFGEESMQSKISLKNEDKAEKKGLPIYDPFLSNSSSMVVKNEKKSVVREPEPQLEIPNQKRKTLEELLIDAINSAKPREELSLRLARNGVDQKISEELNGLCWVQIVDRVLAVKDKLLSDLFEYKCQFSSADCIERFCKKCSGNIQPSRTREEVLVDAILEPLKIKATENPTTKHSFYLSETLSVIVRNELSTRTKGYLASTFGLKHYSETVQDTIDDGLISQVMSLDLNDLESKKLHIFLIFDITSKKTVQACSELHRMSRGVQFDFSNLLEKFLANFISEIKQNLIPSARVVDWMVAVGNNLNEREDQKRVATDLLRILKLSAKEESALKIKLGILFHPGNCEEVQQAILLDISPALKSGSRKRELPIFRLLVESLKEEILKQGQISENTEELLRLIGREWLLDFDVTISQLIDGEERPYQIEVLDLIWSTQERSATSEDLLSKTLTKMRDFLVKISKQELTFFQFLSLKGEKKNLELLLHSIVNYINAGQFKPGERVEKKYLESWNAMLGLYAEKERIVSTINMLIEDEDGNFAKLSKEQLIENLKLIQDPKRGTFSVLKKCAISQKTCINLEMFNSLKKYNWIAFQLNSLIAQHQKSPELVKKGQIIDLVFFENLIQRSFDDFSLILKQSILRIPEATYTKFESTFKVFQEEWKTKAVSTLVNVKILSPEESKRLHENLDYLMLLKEAEPFTYNLLMIQEFLITNKKIGSDSSKIDNFVRKNQLNMELFAKNSIFERDMIHEKFDDQESALLQFVIANGRLISLMPRTFKLVLAFKDKESRHFQDIIVERDTYKYKTLTSDYIDAVRVLVERFNTVKEVESIQAYVCSFESIFRVVEIVAINPDLGDTLIQCSEEFLKDDKETNKIEKIMSDSRVLLVYQEDRHKYTIFSAYERPAEESFKDTKDFALSGKEKGRKLFNLEEMQDVKFKISLTGSMTESSVEFNELKRSYGILMKSLEKIQESIIIIKRRGCILSINELLVQELEIMRRERPEEREAITKTLNKFKVNGSDFMLLVKKESEMVEEPYYIHHAELIALSLQRVVEEMESSVFETKIENHWMHFLDGKQLEMLQNLCSSDEEMEEGYREETDEKAVYSALNMIPGFISMTYERFKESLRGLKLGNNYQQSISALGQTLFYGVSIDSSQLRGELKIKLAGFGADRFKAFFDTLTLISYKSDIHPSQVFFASSGTSIEDMQVFLRRAFYDPEQRWYFLLDLHLLTIGKRNELIRLSKQHLDTFQHIKNTSIIFFMKKESTSNVYNELNKYREYFENLSLTEKCSQENDRNQNIFISNIPCETIASELSGLGKSFFIRECARKANVPLQTLFISGEIAQNTIEKRVSLLTPEKSFLHIKIDMMDNMLVNCEILDQILFRICFLRVHPFKGGWYNFKQFDRFFIEVSNNYKTELLRNVSFLTLNSKVVEIARLTKESFKGEMKLKFVEGQEKKASTIVHAWNGYRSKKLGGMNIENYMKEAQLLSEADIKKELLGIFLNEANPLKQRKIAEGNYNQLITFVNVVFKQLSEMSEVSSLNPDFHTFQTGDKKRDFDEFTRQLGVTRLRSIQLIFELANDLVWSVVSEVRKESQTAIEIMKNQKNFRREDLVEYQKEIQKIPKWELDNKLNIIFNNGSMKVIFKDLKKLDKEIAWIVTGQSNRGLLDESKVSKNTMEYYRMMELFEALDLVKFIDTKYLEKDEVEKAKKDHLEDSLARPDKKRKLDISDYYMYKLNDKRRQFKGKGYSLTKDNYLKILNIAQRAALRIPIVIMGATGCGKTYMIDFIANFIFKEEFCCFTLHSGVSEEEIEHKLGEAIVKAHQSPKRIWFLWDEFNTSPYQSLITEIITERRCTFSNRITSIPDNIVFVAACNPFRISVNNSRVGLVHESSAVILSHRVYPIPQTLIDYIWDFGQLSEEVETDYIICMMQDKVNEYTRDTYDQEMLAQCVVTCQSFLRQTDTDSSVSLRDVQRFSDMYKYFFGLLRVAEPAMVMAAYTCYFFRIDSSENKSKLCVLLQQKVKRLEDKFVQSIFNIQSQAFIEDVEKLDVIPPNISINQPLIENLLALSVATINRIPAIICGKPGTSKTVAVGIIYDIFNKPSQKKNQTLYFKDTPQLIQIPFWGSITTTSQGIIDVFRMAKEHNEKNIREKSEYRDRLEQIPYVSIVFDEIGLAEIADKNPLKVLHPLLEERNQIGFIGLSNWKLDLSKMNRVVFVARPDMSPRDLLRTCESKENNCKNLNARMEVLSESYAEFRKNQEKETSFHPNFYGSRDFYQMIRIIKSQWDKIKGHPDELDKIDLLVETSIERNFSGMCIENGKQRSSYSLRQLYNSKCKVQSKLTKGGSSSMELIFQNLIDNDSRHLMIFSESIDIDDVMVSEIKRFMVEVKGRDPQKFEFLRKSHGVEDMQSLFSKLQSFVKQGYTVVLKDLDTVYGCLYDLLNQNYVTKDGKKGCTLFFDNQKEWINVHEDFKCIILMEREDTTKTQLDLEKKQQPPFLNRFEKHLVLYEDLINSPDELKAILEKEKQLISSPDDNKYYLPQWQYHNLSRELVYSQGLQQQRYITRHATGQTICRSIDEHYARLFAMNGRDEMVEAMEEGRRPSGEANKRWRQLQSRNMILHRFCEPHRANELAAFEKEFLDSHPYNDLKSYLQSEELRPRSIVFTYSPAWAVKEILEKNEQLGAVLAEGMEVYMKSIEERDVAVNELLQGNHRTVLLQFRERQEWRYIQDFRYKLDLMDLHGKKVVLLAHTTLENVQERLMVSTSINLATSNWEMAVIDNLGGCNYREFFKLLGLSMDEILGQEVKQFENFNTRFFKDIVRENVKAAMIDQANHFDGLSRTTNFIWLLERYPELFSHIVKSARAEPSLKDKKLHEMLTSSSHLKTTCRSYLDCEDMVKETVRVGYRKSIQKVLEAIKLKVGFGLLFLSRIVGNQEEIFVEWLDILQTDNPFPSVMFNNEFEQVDLVKYYTTFKDDIQKGIQQIEQIDISSLPSQLTMSLTKGPASEQIENIIHRILIIPADLGTRPFEREFLSEDKRLLFALQVTQKYLRDLGSDDFLRLLTEMMRILQRQDSFQKYFKGLGSTVLLCLVVADLYKKDIVALAELNHNEEKSVRKKRTALDNFADNLVLASIPQIEDLIKIGKIDSRAGLSERTGSLRELLRRKDSYEDRWVDCLRLLVKFMEDWGSIAAPQSKFEKVKVGFNNLRLQTIEPQNMILEIIQLAVQSWDVQETRDFVFKNLFETLSTLNKSSVHRTVRLQCITLLGKPIFLSEECADHHMACFTSFVVKNELMTPVLSMFGEIGTKKVVYNNIRKFYFQLFMQSTDMKGAVLSSKQLIQAMAQMQALIDANDTTGFYDKSVEFKQAMEYVRSKRLTVAEGKEIDKALKEMYDMRNNQSCLLLIAAIYETYKTSEDLKSAGFAFVDSVLQRLQKASTDLRNKMLPTSEVNYEVMVEFDQHVMNAEEEDLVTMDLGFFANFEILNNIALNREPETFEQYRRLVEKSEQLAQNQHLKRMAELIVARGERSSRDDLMILFMIGNTVNMLEALGKGDWLGQAKDYILVNYPTSEFSRKAKLAKELESRPNRPAFVMTCDSCDSIVSQDDEEGMGGNDRCEHCERPLNAKRINTFEFMQSFKELERSQRAAVNYEDPNSTDPSLWLVSCYHQEIGQPMVAFFMHLLQYFLYFVRETCCEGGLHFAVDMPELNKEEYIIKHIKNDLGLLCETGGVTLEEVTKMYTVAVLVLRNNLDKESDGEHGHGGDILRREASKVFKSLCAKLKANLAKYDETAQRNHHTVFIKYNPQFEVIFGDQGPPKENKPRQSSCFEDIRLFLQKKPKVSAASAIAEIQRHSNSKKDLKSSFLLEVYDKQELLGDFSRVMSGARRFFSFFKRRYEMLLSKEDLERLTMNQLMSRTGPKEDASQTQELQSEFKEFASCLSTLSRLVSSSPALFRSLSPSDLPTIAALIAGDEALLGYLVVDWNSSRRVLETALKDLVGVQNQLLEKYYSLSIYQTGSKAKYSLTKVSDKAIVSPYSELDALLETHTVLSTGSSQHLSTDIDFVTSTLADGLFPASVVPLFVDPFFDYCDNKNRDFKELVARVGNMLGVARVTDHAKLLSESRFVNLGFLAIRVLAPIEKILKLVLPRISNGNVYTAKSPINQLIPSSGDFASERGILAPFTLSDLDGIRRVIMISRWAATRRDPAEDPRPNKMIKAGYRLAVELKVLYGEQIDPQTEKLSKEKETRRVEDLSDLLEEEDFTMLGDIMHELDPSVPQGSETGKKLTVKQFPSVIKAIEEKYTVK
jgi:hypothetical protein